MNSAAPKQTQRSLSLHSIRPDLQLPTQESQTLEYFQNKVLRPILKFQNDLFLCSFSASLQFQQHMSKIDATNKKHYEKGIVDFLSSNNAFRNRMYGYVLGMMTIQEFQEYMKEESEYNRRIRSMLIKRVLEQLYSV